MSTAFSEWGIEGARIFDGRVGATIIVDVLSFSTCVDIAVARGASVHPFAYGNHNVAEEFAISLGAEIAGPRGNSGYRYSLSPGSLSTIAAGARLVLPSPNGSAISATPRSAHVLAGCLRNVSAVAKKATALSAGRSIAVIPAGERWTDGSLRPAIEDLLGAGAILHALGLPCSPEAEVVRLAFLGARGCLAELVRGSVSGEELIRRGYPGDVDVAIEYDVSAVAPLLLNGAYSN
jgi:2-phosphosulfolactate phosphatase